MPVPRLAIDRPHSHCNRTSAHVTWPEPARNSVYEAHEHMYLVLSVCLPVASTHRGRLMRQEV